MKADLIEKWLPLIGTRMTDKGSGWVEAYCPLAPWRHTSGQDKHPSFGVKVMPGDSRTWCFSCHYGGTQTELINELHHLGASIQWSEAYRFIQVADEGESLDDIDFVYEEARATQEVVTWPDWYLDGFERAYLPEGEKVHPYLDSRGVSYEFAKTWDLRWDSYEYRICFPIRDYHDRLTGLHGRSISNNVNPRYRVYLNNGESNPSVWLGEHLVDRDKPLVLVESVFDLARVWEFYENVMTPLRSGINTSQLDRIKWSRQIICFFDADKAGKMAYQRVHDAFKGRQVLAVWPPDGMDPGEMDERDIAETLGTYVEVGR